MLAFHRPYQEGDSSSEDDNTELTRDLGFAIWQALRKKLPIDECRMMAASMVKHLRLCGWE